MSDTSARGQRPRKSYNVSAIRASVKAVMERLEERRLLSAVGQPDLLVGQAKGAVFAAQARSISSAIDSLSSVISRTAANHEAAQLAVAISVSKGLVSQLVQKAPASTSQSSTAFPVTGGDLTGASTGIIGQQPVGALTGKIVYTSAGHGWQWNSTLNRFATDRGDNNEIVEDFGNQDQMTYYVDYLLRAGATVVPMRPVGRQLNEVVLDNDSVGVTYTGTWSNNTAGPIWYDEDYGAGGADPVKYRFANVNSGSETAIATYTPSIPQSGFYPVYSWVAHGGNRTSQLYKINHTGGQTQMRVDHRLVGNGWVYLGTYHFNSGSSAADGSVQISNHSTAGGSVVIADAIRFGNGMGDLPWGSGGIGSGSVSGYPREDENSLMWLWRGVGLSTSFSSPSSIIGTSNVSAPAKMAEYMNANTNPFGTSVYIGFHSNAGGGRGAVGLMTNSTTQRTPNQEALATYTGRQINQDMQALNGVFEHNWSTRTTHTYAGINFGEITRSNFVNSSSVVEMDGTIIETAFHDDVLDAQLMRDPKVRDQLARSTYEATLEYFNNHGGVSNTTTVPSAPRNVRVASNSSGAVTINWNAGPTGVYGHSATGYRIYTSTDGYGFDGGTVVSGGGTTSATISGLDPNVPHYFKVAAMNLGGESLSSEVLAARPSGGAKQVLIVNGFDRFDRTQNFRYPYAFTGDGLTDRVWDRYNNSFDYSVQVASAIQAAEPGTRVAGTSNEAVISGAVKLTDYESVIWILGNESTANRTFDSTEQLKVEQFIAAGGHLFVTGSEIAWDLDQQNNGRSFYRNTLKGTYVADSANTFNVTAAAGSIFAGLSSFSFSSGSAFSSLTSQTFRVSSPDVITPQAGAQLALNYSGGTGGGAAIQHVGTGGRGNVVMFGFPFETITNSNTRRDIMGRVLDFFVPAPSATPGTPTLHASTDSGISSSDRLTNFNNSSPARALQIVVPGTVAGADVTIFADGAAIGSAVASGTTTTVTTNGSLALAEGARSITARQTEPGKPQSAASPTLTITIDTVAPTVSASAFNWLTSQSVTFTYSENIATSILASDLALLNVDIGQTIPAGNLSTSYNAASRTSTFTWPMLSNGANGVLPDGNYRATLSRNNVQDAAGNMLAANHSFILRFLQGDTNRDGTTDIFDFNTLVGNFGMAGDFSKGDFNYDGFVDILDFNILSTRMGNTLPPAPPA
jgi:hypothetical protein